MANYTGARLGRPPKPPVEYDDDKLDFIKSRLLLGVTEKHLAQQLGISAVQFTDDKNNNEELKAVVENVAGQLESEVTGYLMKMIRNPDHKSHAPCVFFYLKTKCRWRESDAVPPTFQTPDGIKFRQIKSSDVNNDE